METGQTNGTSAIILTLLSGAVGAILALFVKAYLDHRRRIYLRRLKHSNSLVSLELRLLDIGAVLHDNLISFDAIVEGAKKGRIMMGRPVTLVLEDKFFNDFYVLELNNRLYSFRYDLRRINSDIDNFNRVYGMLSDAVMLKQIDDKHFAMHLSGLLAEQDKLKQGLQELLDKSVQLLGYVQVRMEKDRTWLMRHRGKIVQDGIKPVSDEEVQEKVEKHLKDIADNG